MQIIAKCPECGNPQLLAQSCADRRVRCTRCRAIFKVPQMNELSQAEKIIKTAKGAVYVDKDGKTYG